MIDLEQEKESLKLVARALANPGHKIPDEAHGLTYSAERQDQGWYLRIEKGNDDATLFMVLALKNLRRR
ncbi:MAG: hypothetical protein ABL949_11235 [Fimbriimonadaceae bacterium]